MDNSGIIIYKSELKEGTEEVNIFNMCVNGDIYNDRKSCEITILGAPYYIEEFTIESLNSEFFNFDRDTVLKLKVRRLSLAKFPERKS